MALGVVGGVFYEKFEKKRIWNNIFYGILIGVAGIALLMNSVRISDGLIFDTRSILVSVTGLFFGTLPTLIVVVIISAFRIFIGGSGALTGVVVMILTATLGVIWNKIRLKNIISTEKKDWLELYLFSLSIHIIMILCMLTLPGNIAFETLKKISIPILIIYPLVSLVLCRLIINRVQHRLAEKKLFESELKLNAVIQSAPIGVSIFKEDKILVHNRAWEEILCRKSDEFEINGLLQYTHPDDVKEELKLINDLKRGMIDNFSLQKKYIKPDGSNIWVNMIVAAFSIEAMNKDNYICMIEDITSAKKAEIELKDNEKKYKGLFQEYKMKQSLLNSLLNSIPDLIFYKDINSIYMGCNKAFESFTGLAEESLIGRTDFDVFEKSKASMLSAMDSEIMEKNKLKIDENEVIYPDGHRRIMETLRTPYYGNDGEVLGLIGISRDITERKQKEQKIQYMTYHDVMTGLYNRAYFDHELERIDDSGELPYSIIIGDIDGLKIINDIWGHAEGDKTIIETANLIKKCCRPNDMVARIGGDEFVILLPQSNEVTAKSVYDQIMGTFDMDSLIRKNNFYNISISMGFATKSIQDQKKEDLLKIADDYMYRRKLLGQTSLRRSILSAITTSMFEKSNETEEHAERMVELSYKLGVELGLTEYDLISLELAAKLHDIGKIGVSKETLEKPGKLNEDEWIEIKKHPDIGYRIAKTIPELSIIAEYILCHHERWDGQGYPRGLSGDNIPLISRIISVVDSYDAMIETRSYKKALSREVALSEIIRNSGTQFDPKIAFTFVNTILSSADAQ